MTQSNSRQLDARLLAETAVSLALWGSIPVVIRFVSANPFTIGVFRLTLASAIVFLLFVRWSELARLRARDWGSLALMGLCFGLHWGAYFFSIKLAGAAIGAIGLSAYGIFLILLGALFRETRLRPMDLLAVALAAGGSVLLVPELSLRNQTVLGLAIGSFSALMFAMLPILHRRNQHLPASIRTFGQFFFALLLFTVFLPFTRWKLPATDWLALLYLAIFCTVISHSLWVRVTTALDPATTSTVYYAYLPVSLGLAALLLGEQLTYGMLLGATLIVSGSVLAVRRHATPPPTPTPTPLAEQ